jgi:glucosamine 6-phosphate synthetase-like amidotransferase/phosphosugar isomerase protein
VPLVRRDKDVRAAAKEAKLKESEYLSGVEEGMVVGEVQHGLIEVVHVLVSKKLILQKVPPAPALVVAVVVARAREIDPLGVAPLVACTMSGRSV